MKNYLDSKTAVKDYTELLSVYKSAKNDDFIDAWHEKLQDHGVETLDVNEDDLAPYKLVSEIEANVKLDKVFSQFTPVTNVDSGVIPIDKSTDTAWGHIKLATKKVQEGILDKRPFNPEAIYKLQKIDHMTFLKGGNIVRWIMDELPKHVVKQLSRAILVGGVKNEDNSAFTAVQPIIGDELTGTVDLADDSVNTIIASIYQTLAEMDATKPVVFIKPSVLGKIVTQSLVAGGRLNDFADQIPATIVPTTIMEDAPDNTPFVVVDTDAYLLGFAGSGLETLSDFEINTNSEYIESRVYVAGSLRKQGGAVVGKLSATSSEKA